jgi:ketosteroid isomerase-like protein
MLSHHDAIRQIAVRYSHGVDRLDLAAMQSAYWPDAVDDHGVFVGDAMEFCELVVRSHGRDLATMHCVLNHLIELADDELTATGEVYNVTYLHRLDGDRPVLDTWWGRYLDRYERRGDEWRIIHRTCVHEWTTSTPVQARMAIDAARFRQGSADRGQ